MTTTFCSCCNINGTCKKSCIKSKVHYQNLKLTVAIDEALKKSLLFKPRIIKKGNPDQKIKSRKIKLKVILQLVVKNIFI